MDSANANRQLIDRLPTIAHQPENLETLLDAVSFRERLLSEIKKSNITYLFGCPLLTR